MKTERYYPPDGSVMSLADEQVDPRKASLGWGIVCLLLLPVIYLSVNGLYTTSNQASGIRLAGGAASQSDATPRGAILLIDGMRRDEAASLKLPGLHEVDLKIPLPTVSVPSYHEFATGVSRHSSGILNNRYHEGPRYDTIGDRVREQGTWRFISDDPKWMTEVLLFTKAETHEAKGEAMLAAIDAWDPAKEVLFVHHLRLDDAGHQGAIDAQERRDALSEAHKLISRVLEKAGEVPSIVFSDHGHVDRGGHGGDEQECIDAVCLVPGWIAKKYPNVIGPTHLPEIFTLLGIEAPRHHEDALLHPTPAQLTRKHAAVTSLALATSERSKGRPLALMLSGLLCIALLGTAKRCFGLSRFFFLAPMLALLVAGVAHAIWRPFGMSSIDYVYHQIGRLVLSGVAGSLVAMLVLRGSTDSKYQSTAGLVWGSCSLTLLVTAHVNFTFYPWPSNFASYAPMAFAGTALGVALCCSPRFFWLAFSSRASQIADSPQSEPE